MPTGADGLVRGRAASGMSYTRRGSGRPVLLVHGWCLSGGMWSALEAALVDDHDVLTPDLPGFGRSDDLAGPYDLERHAGALGELLDELDLHDVLLVGFAFGAAVGMVLAAAGGSRLGGLVAIGVPSAGTAPYGRMPAAMRADWPDFARRSALAICDRPHSDAKLAWLAGLFAATPLPVALATVAVLEAFEPEPLAPSVGVPALFVHGEQDVIVPVAVSHGCARRAPRGRLELVAESGHLVVLDQPGALEELVREFAAHAAEEEVGG